MKLVHYLFIPLVLCSTFFASAQVLGPYKVDNIGTLASVKLTAAEKSSKSLVFYMLTNQPSTNAVEVYVKGPIGSTITVRQGMLGNQSVEQAVSNAGRLFATQIRGTDGIFRPRLAIPAPTSAFRTAAVVSGKSSDSYTACINSSEVRQLLELCRQQGISCPVEQICGAVSSGSGSNSTGSGSGAAETPTTTSNLPGQSQPATGTNQEPLPQGINQVLGLFHFHKDMCSPSRRGAAAQYIAVVTVDLSKTPEQLYQSGFEMQFGVKEYVWKGGREGSIKAKGDGRIKGALALASSISFYNNKEYFNFVTWSGGRPSRVIRIPVGKWANYSTGTRGYSLSVAGIQRLMTGGRATFELSDGSWIYSAGCPRLLALRQSFNGYPIRG